MKSRRMPALTALALVIIVIVSLVIVNACGTASSTSSAFGTPGGPAPLVMNIDADPTYFNPLAMNDVPTGYVGNFLFTGLYKVDNKFNTVPDMADGMPDVSPDGLVWTVRIKQGIKFHNGQELTADDVVFTYSLASNPNLPNPITSMFVGIVDKIEKVDQYTVRITLKQPYAPFLALNLSTPILPEGAVEASANKLLTPQFKAAVAANEQAINATLQKYSQLAPPSDVPANQQADALAGLQDGMKPEMKALLDKVGVTGYADTAADMKNKLTTLSNIAAGGSDLDMIASSMTLLDFNLHPIGTGAWKFDEYKSGEYIKLSAFDDFYRGKPPIRSVYIPIIKDELSATQSLIAGDILWKYELSSDALPSAQKAPNLKIAQYADPAYYYIGFNLREGHIFSDKLLRQAFAYAIDKARTVQVATDGNGTPVWADVPPGSWAYDPNVKTYPQDLEKARALIKQAGWTIGSDGIAEKNGQKLSFNLLVRQGKPERVKFAELVADQVRQVGIDMHIQQADFQSVMLPKLQPPFDFEAILMGWNLSPDPDDFQIFHSSQIPDQQNPMLSNFGGYSNKVLDQLIEQGRTTMDQNARKQIYAQIQNILSEDQPYYFGWADLGHAGISKRVVGEMDLTSPYYYATGNGLESWQIMAR